MMFTGDNSLNARRIFEARKLYRDNAFKNLTDKLDFWSGSDSNYGKVNFANQTVYLSESNLKQLSSSNGVCLAADFVVNAFDEMKEYIQKAVALKKVDPRSSYIKLDPVRGWTSVNELHHIHVDYLYKMFVVGYLLEGNQIQSIESFEHFLAHFLGYMQFVKNPFTRTGFILSRFCPPNISGLVIELTTDDKSQDLLKQVALVDPNFDFVKKTLKKFGFYIDKNAPYRLVADITSPRMIAYMKDVGIDEQSLFAVYFYKALDYEIEILKTYLTQMWETLIRSYPVAKKVRSSCLGRVIVKTYSRQIISEDVKNDRGLWLRAYLTLRRVENGLEPMRPARENQVIKTALDIEEKLDKVSAISYLEGESAS